MLEPSDIEEILETLVSDARLECDKQLTGSGGGRALFEKLYRMRPSFAFIDDEVRAYTICTCQARAMPVPCPHHARTMPAPGPRVHERARLCVPHLLVQLAGRGWQAAAAVPRDHCVAGPGVRDQCALVARVVSDR